MLLRKIKFFTVIALLSTTLFQNNLNANTVEKFLLEPFTTKAMQLMIAGSGQEARAVLSDGLGWAAFSLAGLSRMYYLQAKSDLRDGMLSHLDYFGGTIDAAQMWDLASKDNIGLVLQDQIEFSGVRVTFEEWLSGIDHKLTKGEMAVGLQNWLNKTVTMVADNEEPLSSDAYYVYTNQLAQILLAMEHMATEIRLEVNSTSLNYDFRSYTKMLCDLTALLKSIVTEMSVGVSQDNAFANKAAKLRKFMRFEVERFKNEEHAANPEILREIENFLEKWNGNLVVGWQRVKDRDKIRLANDMQTAVDDFFYVLGELGFFSEKELGELKSKYGSNWLTYLADAADQRTSVGKKLF